MMDETQKIRETFAHAAGINLHRHDSAAIILKNLTINRPDEVLLITGINLTLSPSDRLMITGASGSGKSMLFRALKGLKNNGSGEALLPQSSRYLWIPQKPYLPLQPLKDILCAGQDFTDSAVAHALEDAGLSDLIPFINDESKDGAYWSKNLSGGQQQILMFAKIFLHKPDILMLDEVTASIDPQTEARLYRHMIAMLPNTIIVSISHRPELARFHNRHAMVMDQKLHIISAPDQTSADIPPAPAVL